MVCVHLKQSLGTAGKQRPVLDHGSWFAHRLPTISRTYCFWSSRRRPICVYRGWLCAEGELGACRLTIFKRNLALDWWISMTHCQWHVPKVSLFLLAENIKEHSTRWSLNSRVSALGTYQKCQGRMSREWVGPWQTVSGARRRGWILSNLNSKNAWHTVGLNNFCNATLILSVKRP
jgi:hypothetical protein